jgi:hypothetical protein
MTNLDNHRNRTYRGRCHYHFNKVLGAITTWILFLDSGFCGWRSDAIEEAK